jgi:hypothetical protein
MVPVAFGRPSGGHLKLVAIWEVVRNYISDILYFAFSVLTGGGGGAHVAAVPGFTFIALVDQASRQTAHNRLCNSGGGGGSNPITGLDRHSVFQEVGAPRFSDNRHMYVVSLSELRIGRLYPPPTPPPEIFLVLISVRG